VLVRVKTSKIKDVDRIPREIDGVKTDVIEVVAHANTTRILPAPGGVSICNATSLTSTGTYGCLLRRTMEPNLYILSNNHVFANFRERRSLKWLRVSSRQARLKH
jgi:hypothetical protein